MTTRIRIIEIETDDHAALDLVIAGAFRQSFIHEIIPTDTTATPLALAEGDGTEAPEGEPNPSLLSISETAIPASEPSTPSPSPAASDETSAPDEGGGHGDGADPVVANPPPSSPVATTPSQAAPPARRGRGGNRPCKTCGNAPGSRAHKEACKKGGGDPGDPVGSVAPPAAPVVEESALPDSPRVTPAPELRVDEPCPRCSGRIRIDDEGDLVCGDCGARKVAKTIADELLALGEPHVHRFKFETPNGPTTTGKCACGETSESRNAWGTEDGSVPTTYSRTCNECSQPRMSMHHRRVCAPALKARAAEKKALVTV